MIGELVEPYDFDVFISHASEDKDEFVRPLAEALRERELRIWYDEWEVVVGDRLRQRIEDGLRRSRFGVVVLSPSFFAKNWPKEELDGLATMEVNDGRDRILPVWLNVDRDAVAAYSLSLAGRAASLGSRGLNRAIEDILRAVERTPAVAVARQPARRAALRSSVDSFLRPRNLVGDEGSNFARNDDSVGIMRFNEEARAEPVVVLSLVPTGLDEELDEDRLWRYREEAAKPASSPLSGQDARPRREGLVILHQTNRNIRTRYTWISGDGYIEWGRDLGAYEASMALSIVRLSPLLWSVRSLVELGQSIRDTFELRSQFVLVVSIAHAKGSCLSHLGEGWREPFDKQFGDYYRPTCNDDSVQLRIPLPPRMSQEDMHALLVDVDIRLNRIWGVNEARGHDRAPGQGLRPTYRDDPWEGRA